MVKRKSYIKELSRLRQEIKLQGRVGSFDTIHTSLVVLVIAGILSLVFSGYWGQIDMGLKVFIYFLGTMTLISLMLQVLSLFFGYDLKKLSFYSLTIITLFIMLMFFSAFFPPSFSSWITWASVFIWLLICLLIASYGEKFFE